MSGSDIGMIIRTNLLAPDIQITTGDLLDTDIERVYQEVCDSNSRYLIDSEYLQDRYIWPVIFKSIKYKYVKFQSRG